MPVWTSSHNADLASEGVESKLGDGPHSGIIAQRPTGGKYFRAYRTLAIACGMPHTLVMAYRFTSLQGTIEKLLEAEYFLGGLTTSSGSEFGYNLNAFLSACRSATFVMQKSLSHVTSFGAWYDDRRRLMKSDPAMGFFLELRNISQHEGPVSYVGGAIPHPPGWTYRFAGNREAVPAALVGCDVAAACGEHLTKLASVVAELRSALPHESCLHSALSAQGIRHLGYSLDDVGVLLGLPPGYLDVGKDIPIEHKLRVLRRELDPIDVDGLERLAQGRFQRGGERLAFASSSGHDLTDDIAGLMESGDGAERVPRVAFLTAICRRIQEIDRD